MEGKETKKNHRDNIFKRIANQILMGDRVIWIVFIMLVLFSTVAIFSSTSSLAILRHTSRIAIFITHLKFVGAGLLLALAISALPNLWLFRTLSQLGFILSVILLVLLLSGIDTTYVRVIGKNEAVRALKIFNVSVSVYEIVKIAMVMYLAWAVHTYDRNKFQFTRQIAEKYPKYFSWADTAPAQRWIYIFGPILIITAMILPGSNSSAVLTCIVMFVTIIIGGIKWKQIVGVCFVALVLASTATGIHIQTSGKFIPRIQTLFNRFKIEVPYPDNEVRMKQREKIAQKTVKLEDFEKLSPKERKDYINSQRQTISAEYALVQGGRRIFGKGPGKSTQRYITPLMFSDYMFSFIMEEYGFIGGFLVLLMYMSLFARGKIIVYHCQNRFAKACVGGLVFLITFQALFHVLVNCNIGIVTGQTLPLVSHGGSSFLCFCIAFGVLLSISVQVNSRIKQEQAEAIKENAQIEKEEARELKLEEKENKDESNN